MFKTRKIQIHIILLYLSIVILLLSHHFMFFPKLFQGKKINYNDIKIQMPINWVYSKIDSKHYDIFDLFDNNLIFTITFLEKTAISSENLLKMLYKNEIVIEKKHNNMFYYESYNFNGDDEVISIFIKNYRFMVYYYGDYFEKNKNIKLLLDNIVKQKK